MSNSTHTATLHLNPMEWTNEPNTILNLCYLQTTGNQFGATITVTGTNYAPSPISITQETRSAGYYNAGALSIPWSAFPLKIEAEITCNTDFDIVAAPQQALGLKVIGQSAEPVCYQTTAFCNDNLSDPNKDLDYNDFVVIGQLYNNSTD